jgi:hypothetical protein
MAMDDHVDILKSKHAELENMLARENTRPHPDQSVVADLKKQKLRIKDELARLGRV